MPVCWKVNLYGQRQMKTAVVANVLDTQTPEIGLNLVVKETHLRVLLIYLVVSVTT